MAQNGVVYGGMEILAGGAILVGLIWAAIAAFAIDRKWTPAAIYALLGAALSFFGIIHAGNIALAAAWEPTIGYLIVAAFLGAMIVLFKAGEAPGKTLSED